MFEQNIFAPAMQRLVFFLIIFFFSLPLLGQKNISNHQWKSYLASENSKGEQIYYLLQSEKSIRRADLEKSGVKVIRMLDDQNAIVILKGNFNKRKFDRFSLSPANDQWKLSLNLTAFTGKKELLLVVINEVSFQEKYSVYNPYKVYNSTFRLNAGIALFDKLLSDTNVIHLASPAVDPEVESPVLDYNLTVNTINLAKKLFPDLNGEGITVSVKEDDYDLEDLDLKLRHISSGIGSGNKSAHATEMATIIAGGGNTSVKGTGVAPKANITSSDFMNLFPDPEEKFEELDISVQNHSYGVAVNNTYTAEAAAYDDHIYENPELIHVFSSGNSGVTTSEEGPYAGIEKFANLTGGFKMAKNIITVGAVDSVLKPQELVSRGPAYDGRIKPELVAYSQAGSSSSAAIVSGVAVLLQQLYFTKYGSLPDAALIKAALINSAKDTGPSQVDFIHGFGNVDAVGAIKSVKENRFISASIADSESKSFFVDIPANTGELKITLVWTDTAASPNAGKALVNDVDMQVKNNGIIYNPWILNSFPHIDSLTKPAVRGEDHLNNIEQITIDNPQEGIYEIVISGYDISTDQQEFYIVYDHKEKERFSWTYPAGDDNFPYDGERVKHIRWKTDLIGDASLYYQLNGGNWMLASNDVTLDQEFYYWNLEDTTAVGRLKMAVNDEEYLSDEFTISKPLKLKIGFNCTDSLMLSWNHLPNVTSYNVFGVFDDELKNFVSTGDTSIIIYKDDIPSEFFAVEPAFEHQTGFRSANYNYSLQGVDCYVSSFLVNEDESGNVVLRLRLGTNHQIAQVIFEKLIDNNFNPIAHLQPQLSSTYLHQDDLLTDGTNIYRARISFVGGAEIITEEASVFVLVDLPYVLYPNPVDTKTEYVVVRVRDFEYGSTLIRFYNNQGQLAYEEYLISEFSFIDLSMLTRGIYIYNMLGPQLNGSGKILITR